MNNFYIIARRCKLTCIDWSLTPTCVCASESNASTRGDGWGSTALWAFKWKKFIIVEFNFNYNRASKAS